MFLLSQNVAVSSDVIVSRKYPKIFRWDQKKCAQRTNAAQAAPTEIAQARPSSFMDAVCVTFTPASRQEASSGSVSAGSASSARITSSARPYRSAFFTCLMPTTLLCSMCSSIAGHPHVFARQDSRGHTHARMNYSRINEFRQQDLCLPERKFSIFSAFATLFPQLAQCPKTIRAPLSAPYGFFHPCRPAKSALTRPLPSSPRFQKPHRVSRPQTRNKI